MTTELPLAFLYSPSTRSTGVLILLEGLSAPYSLHLLNMQNSRTQGGGLPRVVGHQRSAGWWRLVCCPNHRLLKTTSRAPRNISATRALARSRSNARSAGNGLSAATSAKRSTSALTTNGRGRCQ